MVSSGLVQIIGNKRRIVNRHTFAVKMKMFSVFQSWSWWLSALHVLDVFPLTTHLIHINGSLSGFAKLNDELIITISTINSSNMF